MDTKLRKVELGEEKYVFTVDYFSNYNNNNFKIYINKIIQIARL